MLSSKKPIPNDCNLYNSMYTVFSEDDRFIELKNNCLGLLHRGVCEIKVDVAIKGPHEGHLW